MSVIEGQTVRFCTVVMDHLNGDALVDPDGLKLTLRAPDGTTIEFIYPDDTDVVHDQLGRFHVDHVLDQPQLWTWRWETIGESYAGGVDEGKQRVRASLTTPSP
jgi:hypothetical protein